MIINLDFNLEAWIKNLQIEAESEEAAKQKLSKMTLEEIFMDDSLAASSDFRITDVTAEITEYNVIAKVTEIKYDLNPDEMDLAVVEYLKNFLPIELTVTLKDVTNEDDIEELLRAEIYGITNYVPESFEFKIIEKN